MNCIYLSGKGFCADLVQSLFDTWWSNSKSTTSLVLNTPVSLLPSLSDFDLCSTTWPYVPATLRSQPGSRAFAGHKGPDTLCYVGGQTGPKPVSEATVVCATNTSLLTSYQSFRLRHWRNYHVTVLNYLGLFWMLILTKKKKVFKIDLLPPICLQSIDNQFD